MSEHDCENEDPTNGWCPNCAPTGQHFPNPNQEANEMSKILVCTDGRDFLTVTCPYTDEDRDALSENGFFDDVQEYELVGERPEIRSARIVDGRLAQDQQFTLFVKDSGTPKAKAKMVLGYDDGTGVDEDGYEQSASGSTDELIQTTDELRDIIDQA